MLLIIHNLPINIRYNDIKSLIHSKCGLTELILDNLVAEGTGKKVTVGVAEEADAAILVRMINGIYLDGHQLYVEDARRKKASEQPYRNTTHLVQETLLKNSYEAPRQSSPSNLDSAMPIMMQPPMVPSFMNMGMSPIYYVPPAQNPPYLGFGGQPQQMINQSMHQYQQPAGQMDRPYAFEPEENNTKFQGGWPSDPGFNNEESVFPSQDRPGAQPRVRSPAGYNRPDREFSARGHERREFSGNEPSRRNQQSRSPPRGNDLRIEVWQGDSSGGRYDRGQQRPFSDRSEGFHQEKFGRNAKPRYGDPRAPPERRSTDNRDRSSHNQGPSNGKNPRWEDTEAYQCRVRDEANSQPRYRPERPDRMPPRYQQSRDHRPGDNRRERDVKAPPPKRMRYQNSDYEEPRTKRFAAQRPDDRNKPIEKNCNGMKTYSANQTHKDTITKIQNRTDTFRGQAASFILKDMMSNPKLQVGVEVIPFLKVALRERIDVLMDGTSDVPRDDIVKLYRISFPKRIDLGFLNKVKKLNTPIKENQDVARDGDPKVAGSSNSKAFVPARPKFVPAAQKPQLFVSAPEGQPPASTTEGRLPKYLEGSKKKHMETKKLNTQETIDPTIYKLEPVLDKVLNEEVDVIVNMFVEEFDNAETETDHHVKKRLTNDVIEELKWLIKLPTTKRILDIKSNLLIRIFGHPKPPKRAPLEAFLKPFGAVSLKKSDRKPLYVAGCDTYENYDRLCSLGEAVIDDITCTFKPMYIAGVPNKRKGIHRYQFGNPQNRNQKETADAVEATSVRVKIEKERNDAEIAANDVAKVVKKEADANIDNKAAIDPAIIDSIKTEIGSDGNTIDSGKTDNVNDTGSGDNETGLVKTDIDSENNVIDSLKDSANIDKKKNEVKNEYDNDNADLEKNNFKTDINDVLANMDDDDDDDDEEDARHDVNFGEIDLDDLADVDVKDLEDDDLEDY